MDGDEHDDEAPFDLRMITLPYDIEEAVRETEEQPKLPNGHLFIREIRSGVYARKQ
jgi:hypothetical protein